MSQARTPSDTPPRPADRTQGAIVTLTATPALGSLFTGWSGDCTGTSPTCTVTVTQAENVTATFALQSFPVTVTAAGTGSGTVSPVAAGSSASYAYGTLVALTATPAAGSLFTGWSGDCAGTGPCLLSMTQARNATATFIQVPPFTALTYEVLYTFSGSDGAHPEAGLVQGPDGAFYGTTFQGGAAGVGTVFRLDPSTRTLTTLHSFTGSDGAAPWAGLLQGSDGALYGTTQYGGVSNQGTLFKLAPDGTGYTLLYAFTGGPADGANPWAGLLQGSDGTLYGTAFGAGTYGYGTVFALDPTTHAVTALHAFGADGTYPTAGLLQGADGNFYGTASSGGPANSGVLFVLRLANPLSVTPAGTGAGTVTSAPAGITCPGTCTQAFPLATSVTLTATPALDSLFTGWSGDCTGTGSCTLGLNQVRNVTATFTSQTFGLTVAKVGSGTVRSNPAGITCGTACSAAFDSNTSVTLTATPASGWMFTGWSGDCSADPCTVSMTQVSSVTATFMVSNIDLVTPAVSDPPATALAGSGFPVTDTVLNQGTGPAGASTTRYYLSVDPLKNTGDRLLTGTRPVPPPRAGRQLHRVRDRDHSSQYRAGHL